ncbi:MAG: zinc ABC transporter substrate-binding protein [Candidatus Aminicenantes bacterium]|nr:zinc ABC transporter substrate-binding protein [Candidatus Aminicenantes bacterium]
MRKIVLVISVLLILSGCGREKQNTREPGRTAKEKLPVTVSILPQKYFVERIGGDKVAVNVMIPPGHSPATYELIPRQLEDLSRSRLYFRIGYIAFEKAWMDNIAAADKNMKIINTAQGVQLIEANSLGEEDTHQGHAHYDAGKDHSHSGVDPHIWLSPRAVKIQAGHIRDALSKLDPANSAFYEGNFRDFAADIDGLNQEMAAVLKDLRSRKFMVFHPAWGYLGRDYNLEQVAIETEGKEPTPANLKKVIDIARQENIRVIFVQKQFDVHSAQTVAAEIEGRVVQLDPLALDWLDNMKQIARAFKEALQ